MIKELFERRRSEAVFGPDYIAPDVKMLGELNTLIEQTFRNNRAPEYYCRELKVSARRLNKLVHTYYGRTVYQHLQWRIHEEVLKLLKFTSLSVKEISYEIGLLDHSYLSRCFKKITGLTPLQYRKQHQELVML